MIALHSATGGIGAGGAGRESGTGIWRHAEARRAGRPGRARPAPDAADGRLARDRARLREPGDHRRDPRAAPWSRRELGYLRRRHHLHVQSPPGRDVPQRPCVRRRRRQIQLRAHPGSGAGLPECVRPRVDRHHRSGRRCHGRDQPQGGRFVVPLEAHRGIHRHRSTRGSGGEWRPHADDGRHRTFRLSTTSPTPRSPSSAT